MKQFYIDQMPAVPVLNKPDHASRICDATPTFDWAAATGAITYRIQVDGHASFPSPAINTTTHASSYTPSTPLAPTLWFWRARGESTCGHSAWSVVRSFHLDPGPATPSGPSPADGATSVGLNADLDWASSAGASTYDVYFGTASTPPFVANVSSSEYALPTLSTNTRYYWKVVGKNSCGNTPGPVWEFTTGSGAANRPPENVSLWPNHGGRPAGRRVNFTSTYRDRDSWRDLAQVFQHIGRTTASAGNVMLRYDVRKSKLYMNNNAGTGWIGGCVPGSAQAVRNRQAVLNCFKSTVTKSGRILKVKWNLLFKAAFRGRKNTYMRAVDRQGARTPWEMMGTWRVK
jgi:hypothetical protein